MSNINGRGSTISIRGLGPQYAVTTINGQVFKSADFTAGFRFDIIQTELAKSVQVIKSPTADMDAGGLSGTINIETTKPLDYDSRQLVVSVKGQNSSYAGGKITPKVGVSYVDQFANGTLGVYLNLGYQKLRDRADYFWIDRWTTQTIDGDTVSVPLRPRYRRIDRTTERYMASGGIQWKPTDSFELDATGIYSRDNTNYDVNQQVFLFNSSTLTVNQVKDGVSVNTTDSDFTMENNRQEETHRMTSQGYTLTGKWTGDNGWFARGVVNYTKGSYYDREDAAILGITIPSATLDTSDPSNIVYSVGTNLTDTSAYAQDTLVRDEYPDGATNRLMSQEFSGQFDFGKAVDFGPISKLQAGAKYRHETFRKYVTRHDLASIDNPPEATTTIFPSLASSNYLVSGFLNSEYDMPVSWIAPDIDAYQSALTAAGITVPEMFEPESSYHVDRYMPSVYAMADIDTDVGAMRLRGNVGVRYEYTHQRVDGNITAPLTGDYTEVEQKIGTYTQTKNYSNVLPSLNLVLEPSSSVQVRFAAAKVLVRPILDDKTSMAETTSTTANTYPVGTNTVTVDLGEGNLKPLTANQLDLGVEWDFSRTSSIAIDGFYKWIKNGTYSSLICPSSFDGTALAANSDGECVDSSGNIYEITQTLNDPSVIRIKGFEVSWNQSFDRILPVDGFGLTGNFTRVFPQKVEIDTGYTVRNLSKVTWNVTPYWENKHFSIRAAINYRSSYKQTNADSFFAHDGHTVRARTQIDLSGGYAYNDHISFTAGAINLNKASEEAYYNNDPAIWQESSYVGRSFYAAVTVKM